MNAGKHNLGWPPGFLFLGNQLALDLLNTRPAPDEDPVELLLDFSALLDWFQAARILQPHEVEKWKKQWGVSKRAGSVLCDIRQFREALRGAVLRWESGSPVSRSFVRQLNSLMARHPMRERLVPGAAKLLSIVEWFAVREPEDLLAPLAHAAAQLFAEADRTRVRKCAHCVAHFCDTSKKGTRRWCSMQLCGNRLKVAAYAARQRRSRHPKRASIVHDPA